jgi:hypothetical protein
MTRLRDRVVALLLSRVGDDLCVGCIASTLAVPHKSAHEAMLKLEARPGFTRRYGRCSACQKTRIVTARTNGAPTAAPDEGGARDR